MITEDDITVTASTCSTSDHAESAATQQLATADTANHSLSSAYQTVMRMNAEEQSHWEDVCRAYRQYAAFAAKQFGLNHPYRLSSLPAVQQAVLPSHLRYGTEEFSHRLKMFKEAAIRNQFCLDCILRHAGQPHSQKSSVRENGQLATTDQLSKVSSVLKCLARDWSVEGKPERDMAYVPILRSVQTYLPITNQRRGGRCRVCVPGAGVMRLACELAAAGYTVQGNEFSLYMLLASDFILNGPLISVPEAVANGKQPLSISPWLLETRNVHGSTDPLRTVQIPDQDPYDMIATQRSQPPHVGCGVGSARTVESNQGPEATESTSIQVEEVSKCTAGADFSMAAGDFPAVYGVATESSAWDAVVACFFLDASPSIVEYLQVIHHMLKPGGILISFGPLHWHWSGPAMPLSDETASDYEKLYSHLDAKYLKSYDFCWEDVQQILVHIGFEVLESKSDIPAKYTADERSMLVSEYRCVQLVARKKV
jgi:carnosine N-methyltransferase